jgi:hypothetical protein
MARLHSRIRRVDAQLAGKSGFHAMVVLPDSGTRTSQDVIESFITGWKNSGAAGRANYQMSFPNSATSGFS